MKNCNIPLSSLFWLILLTKLAHALRYFSCSPPLFYTSVRTFSRKLRRITGAREQFLLFFLMLTSETHEEG